MDEALEAFAVERFVFDEGVCHVVENVAVRGQNGTRLVVGLGDNSEDFVVDAGCNGIAVVALLAYFTTEEDHLFLFAERNRTELGAHAVAGDHRTGDACDLGDVTRSAGGDFFDTKDYFFGDAATKSRHELGVELRCSRIAQAVFFGQEQGIAAGTTTGDDGDLLDGVGFGHPGCGDGVASFVVGDQQFSAVGHHTAAAFWAAEGDAFDGVGQFELANLLFGATGCQDGGFVDGIGKVSTRKTGGQFGNHRQIDIVTEGLALGVDAEDGDTALEVGSVEDDLTIESAWANQGWIER